MYVLIVMGHTGKLLCFVTLISEVSSFNDLNRPSISSFGLLQYLVIDLGYIIYFKQFFPSVGVGEGCHIESLGTLAMVPWISFQEVCCSPQRKMYTFFVFFIEIW
ncbi:hypothetical protein Hanom_Chr02g00149741 [Helianthus anomalus]